jgi:SAM-dependent methyltransferase
MKDIFGKAVMDYQQGDQNVQLLIHNHYGKPDVMAVSVYFRSAHELSAPETYAISLSKGKVLEVGAGAGSICLALQKRGVKAHALEVSPGCVEVMKARGLGNIIHDDFFNLSTAVKYDTILLLMNGIGLGGELPGLAGVFNKLRALLNPGGQIIFDSSDVAYLYDDVIPAGNYYGEITYRYQYAGEFGDWFKWLYVDFATAREIAGECGLGLQLIMQEDTGQYLARAVNKD